MTNSKQPTSQGKPLGVIATQSNPELQEQHSVIKSLPLVKIKRTKYNGKVFYKVYKLVDGNYKVKKVFYTMHQANRYVKGFKHNKEWS